MSFLKNRKDHEIITSSEFDEEDDDDDEPGGLRRDDTSDDGSDSETVQLIKMGNGSVKNSSSQLRNASTYPNVQDVDKQTIHSDLINPEPRNDSKNGPVRNGSVFVNIPSSAIDLPNGDGSIPLETTTDIHRYRTKDGKTPGSRMLKPYPRELKKVAVAAVFCVCNFIATAASLAIVHEYYPLIEPLPDRILDSVPYQPWALGVSEILLSVHVAMAILVMIFHKHRFIVARRVFLILGLLYGYRAITMFVTVLPRSDNTYHCAPKMAEEGKTLTFTTIASRAFQILSGFGLTMNGKHTFCGDYIYSGHTMMFVLAYLIVQEYTSRRFFIFHWLMWMNAVFGVSFLLWGRGHYTIDCIIAYYIATRLWYIYHSMACHPALKKATSLNFFSRIWWWYLFRWFEENVRSGHLPNGFSLPISKKLCNCLRSKSRELVNETSRLTRRRNRAKISKQEA